MKLDISISFIIFLLGGSAKCARILGIFPFAAPSHYRLGHALMRGLAEAGHQVTMVSPNEDKSPPSNGSYRNIVLTGFNEYHTKMVKRVDFLKEKPFQNSFIGMIFFHGLFLDFNNLFFDHKNVKDLLASKEEFDLIILEQFQNDAMKILARHFDAPLILLSTVGPSSWVNNIVGNPSPLSYIPHTMTPYPPEMTLLQKTHNVLLVGFENLLQYFYCFPKVNGILQRNFENPPDISEIYHDASLVLLNFHESMGQAVPLVPNMIPIGGYHIQPPKKLPKDLQEFLDNAKDGVIYFSLGSNLKSKDLPTFKRDVFLKAFGKLKEKVLWKWEDDILPGQPKNVKLGKWLPQQDILAHPNVKLFITHGGLLSSTETVYHGVPILAIPVFGDQIKNALTATQNGYAQYLSYYDPEFSEEKLYKLIQEMLQNPTYTDNVKRRSKIFHDRPLKPMETAIYWVDYVLRHKGAKHLRVAGLQLSWFQYHLLDVFLFILGCTSSGFILIGFVLKKIFKSKKETVKLKYN